MSKHKIFEISDDRETLAKKQKISIDASPTISNPSNQSLDALDEPFNFDLLPRELNISVGKNLPFRDISNLARSSKKYYNLFNLDSTRKILISKLPEEYRHIPFPKDLPLGGLLNWCAIFEERRFERSLDNVRNSKHLEKILLKEEASQIFKYDISNFSFSNDSWTLEEQIRFCILCRNNVLLAPMLQSYKNKFLISSNSTKEKEQWFIENMMSWAVKLGCVFIVKTIVEFLEREELIIYINYLANYAVGFAVLSGSIKMLNYIKELGEARNISFDIDIDKLFDYAMGSGNKEMVKEIMNTWNTEQIKFKLDETRFFALIKSRKVSMLEYVFYLKERGKIDINIDIQNWGIKFFNEAVSLGKVSVAKYILSLLKGRNIKIIINASTLELAIKSGNLAMYEYIKEILGKDKIFEIYKVLYLNIKSIIEIPLYQKLMNCVIEAHLVILERIPPGTAESTNARMHDLLNSVTKMLGADSDMRIYTINLIKEQIKKLEEKIAHSQPVSKLR